MKTLTLKVVQFNTFVKNILDAEEFLNGIGVFGEVTNFKISGGNAYFDLKDESATLSCVKFGAGDFSVKNGDLLTVYGKVNFYIKSGRLNFIVARAEAFGLGKLYEQFLALKSKLEQEGLFREEIKKPIPRFAKRVGVITSETGAVIHDICHVARAKNPYTDIVLYPAKVQGSGADAEIVSGVKYFDSRADIDTIIIARGGGSAEDLSPFNSELLVRAIYAAQKPIISAVGHETDFTLCDFVSDLRVPTPSVAGDIAFYNYFTERENVENIAKGISYFVERLLQTEKKNLTLANSQIIDKTKLKLIDYEGKLKLLSSQITKLVDMALTKKHTALEALAGQLSKLNPLDILKNGYAVVESGGVKVLSTKDVEIGSKINIDLSDGKIEAEVTAKKESL